MSLLERLNKKKPETETPSPPADPLADEKAKLLAEEAALRSGSITAPDAPAPSQVATLSGQTVTAGCGHAVPIEAVSKLPDGTIKHIGCGTAVIASQVMASPNAKAAVTPGEQCSRSGQQIDCSMKEVATKKHVCSCGETVKIKPEEMGEGFSALVPKHKVPGEAPKAEPEQPKAEAGLAKVAGILDAGQKVHDQIAATKGQEELAKYEASLATLRPLTTVDLYAGAIEDGVAYKRLEVYAQRLADRMAESFKVPDVRAAVGDSPVAFGKWKGILAAMVKVEPPAPGAYLVDPSSDFGMVCFEALATMELGRVVRGISK